MFYILFYKKPCMPINNLDHQNRGVKHQTWVGIRIQFRILTSSVPKQLSTILLTLFEMFSRDTAAKLCLKCPAVYGLHVTCTFCQDNQCVCVRISVLVLPSLLPGSNMCQYPNPSHSVCIFDALHMIQVAWFLRDTKVSVIGEFALVRFHYLQSLFSKSHCHCHTAARCLQDSEGRPQRALIKHGS